MHAQDIDLTRLSSCRQRRKPRDHTHAGNHGVKVRESQAKSDLGRGCEKGARKSDCGRACERERIRESEMEVYSDIYEEREAKED